jgi:hypothetical protein
MSQIGDVEYTGTYPALFTPLLIGTLQLAQSESK